MILMAAGVTRIIIIVVVTVVVAVVVSTIRMRATGSPLPRAFGGGAKPEEPKEPESWKQ
ncbi:MAG: hypothetical protein FWC46_04015 [Actinomycetia bacterium]|nr:hypothetical protein [Actinomycetes bacterium]